MKHYFVALLALMVFNIGQAQDFIHVTVSGKKNPKLTIVNNGNIRSIIFEGTCDEVLQFFVKDGYEIVEIKIEDIRPGGFRAILVKK